LISLAQATDAGSNFPSLIHFSLCAQEHTAHVVWILAPGARSAQLWPVIVPVPSGPVE
jgi:hypothetical protein